MALFQRSTINDQLVKVLREQPVAASDEAGFVILIVGLGNPGKEYEDTRHNIGFKAVDAYAKQESFPKWQEKPKFKAHISEVFRNGKKLILVKPTTFMNESGQSIKLLKDFYKLPNNDIIVFHDELDLPFGTVKSKVGGGSAGNNGIKSLIAHLGADFNRVRIGIKNDQLEKMDPADFVLSKFSAGEKKRLKKILEEAQSKLVI